MAAKVQLTGSGAAKFESSYLEDTPRGPFKLAKIVVPLDFSECSRKALEYAIPFAHHYNSELMLLHVLEPYLPWPEMSVVDAATLQAESREYGEKELQNLRESIGSEIRCRTWLRVGKAHREIIEAAREYGADLIIISTHGHRGLTHAVLGSTTERVVRAAHCPVLVVREREHDFAAYSAVDTRAAPEEKGGERPA